MAAAKKSINDYYTIKKRLISDKSLDKFSKTDCFKVPDALNVSNSSTHLVKKKVIAKKVITPNLLQNNKCDQIDIRDALKKAESLEKSNQSSQEKAPTPKRKEISPIFGSIFLSDSKKKKTLGNEEDAQNTCQQEYLNIEKKTDQFKSKVRKKIFEDKQLKTDSIKKDEEKKALINDLKFPFAPLFPLPTSLEISEPKSFSTDTSQKLSLEQVKSRLINCSKLSELKQRLVSINDCANKLLEFQKKTSSPIKINLGPSSPSKIVRPVKHCKLFSPKKILEANDENLKSLALDQGKAEISKLTEPGLFLPLKFQVLSEIFNNLDIVVAMLFNRKESCIFEKVKASVQKMLRKSFDLKKLAIIATVYPEAYLFENEKRLNKETGQFQYQLILTPKIDSDRMLPSHLSERKENFYNKLLDIVKNHHKQFLLSLDPPIIIDNTSLRRWHPRFKLHDIADIEIDSTILPKPPKKNESDSKNSISNFFLHSQAKLGLEVQNKPDDSTDKAVNKKITDKITSGLLKGVSKDLLDKIRAKEAELMVKALTRNPMAEKRLSMIKRLPDLMKIIHNYFIGESKAAQVMDEVVKKCIESYHTFISTTDVENQIKMLAELLPDWIYILNVRKGTYIKIDKQKNLNELFVRLEKVSSKIEA